METNHVRIYIPQGLFWKLLVYLSLVLGSTQTTIGEQLMTQLAATLVPPYVTSLPSCQASESTQRADCTNSPTLAPR